MENLGYKTNGNISIRLRFDMIQKFHRIENGKNFVRTLRISKTKNLKILDRKAAGKSLPLTFFSADKTQIDLQGQAEHFIHQSVDEQNQGMNLNI